MKTLMIPGVFLVMAALAQADTPAQPEVVLTLEAKPPASITTTKGWATLDLSNPLERRDAALADPWGKAYQVTATKSSFTLVEPGSLSVDRVETPGRPEQRKFYKVEDEPGPGYRRIIEWYENIKRPLPRVGP